MQFSSGSAFEPPASLGDLRFVRLKRAHLDQILEIEAASFASPWERRHFERLLRACPSGLNRVAQRGSRVLAYLCASRSEGELKIANLAVHAEFRRLGLGRWMLGRALYEARAEGCRTASLEVRPSNTAALGLYAEFGFVELGRLRNYYREEGEDAIVMRASIRDFRLD